jgi:hypothetical protein
MQPLLTFVAGAVGFAISLWIVRSVLRSIFPAIVQNSREWTEHGGVRRFSGAC